MLFQPLIDAVYSIYLFISELQSMGAVLLKHILKTSTYCQI